jgi:hypothetical protein
MSEAAAAAFIGALLAFIPAFITIIVTARKDKKETFITTVTNVRKNHIKKLRNLSAEFCDLAVQKPKSKQLRRVGYQLKLRINPACKDKFDVEVEKLIDDIIKDPNHVIDVNTNTTNVDEFVALIQSLLAFEWEGMKQEGKRGILKPVQVQALRTKYWKQYKNRKQQ